MEPGSQGAGEPGDSQQAAGGTPQAASGGMEPTPGPVPYERFKAVNEQLAELKRWKDEQDKAAAKAKKDQEAAEAARLAEQNEFKTLAEKHAARLAELEPLQGKAERYEAALTKLLAEQKKGLPAYVLPLLEKLDPAEQLEYIAAHASEFAKPTPPNINATDQGGTGQPSEADQVALWQRLGFHNAVRAQGGKG